MQPRGCQWELSDPNSQQIIEEHPKKVETVRINGDRKGLNN
jgi:hypothetical protein